jgi:hypothetical protein
MSQSTETDTATADINAQPSVLDAVDNDDNNCDDNNNATRNSYLINDFCNANCKA